MSGSRHVLALYIFLFCLGAVFGALLLYFMTRRRNSGHKGRHLPDNSLSSEKGRDLLGSSATPQSPSSASLMSEGFRQEKRNGTATTNTTTTLLSNQGNGNHLGNSFSSSLIHCSPSNGNGNVIYGNCNINTSELKIGSKIVAADSRDERTERELGEGDEGTEGLRDGLGVGTKRPEDELASLPAVKSAAPLARCEESSI